MDAPQTLLVVPPGHDQQPNRAPGKTEEKMGKRPGFKVQRTIYRLKFEGEEFEGLEVEARSLPLGQFFELQEMQAKAQEDAEAAQAVVRKLSEVLLGWNLEDEDTGEPIPCTFDGLKQLELGFVLKILFAWMEAVANVPNPSPPPSNGGGTSLERSIQMDLSSASPGS